jgi:hypothetical protein
MSSKVIIVLMISMMMIIINVFSQQPTCRFAKQVSIDRLLNDNSYQHQFIMNMTYWEGKFATDGIGLDIKSGLTFDGHGIDYNSGELHDPQHTFSAASKECIHLALSALALNGNPYAQNFVKSSIQGQKQSLDDYIVTILTNKINSYEDFNRRYPGFGGYVPWYSIVNGKMELLWDWTDRVPSLDNAEMVWGLFAVAQALSTSGHVDLANRYWKYIQLLADTSLVVFYEGEGRIRCVTKILNITAQPSVGNYKSDGVCYLDDPYEGELMAFFFDLYSDWTANNYTISEREKIWVEKRAKLQQAKYTSKLGPIDVERGWWYSSHEKWKYLMMPYLDVPINRKVFINGERARARFSYEKGYGGLFASVTDVSQPGNYDPGYISATGIQEIAFMFVQTNSLVTPYGAYPLMIDEETRPYGLAWYAAMLKGSKMQGPFGSTEATNMNGTLISPVNTWDSKITSVLAVCGGVGDLVRDALKHDGTYARFTSIIEKEWGRVFNSELRGQDIPFVGPAVTIPSVLPDFTSCTTSNNDIRRAKIRSI